MDRTSQLPDVLIHHILSFLCTDEAARTSVLSKTWQSAWSTNPNFDFNLSYLQKSKTFHAKKSRARHYSPKEKLLKFVDKTLRRYHKQRIPINRFRLSTAHIDLDWMDILAHTYVDKLGVNNGNTDDSSYILFLSDFAPKSLTALNLSFLTLKKQRLCDDQVHAIVKFQFLQKLSLISVYVEEQLIQNMLTGCPVIEELSVNYCFGLNKLMLANLQKLKKADVSGVLEIEIINAPSLQSFKYYNPRQLEWGLNIDSCLGLKILNLMGSSLTDDVFNNIMSKLPLLEDLILRYCDKLERINISNHSIKTLGLFQCRWLKEVKVDVPNLLSFKYHGFSTRTPSLSFSNAPRQWMATIDSFVIPELFLKLRRFVRSLSKFSERLTLWVEGMPKGILPITEDPKQSSDLRQLHEIELLVLRLYPAWQCPVTESILDGLFWSCHPKNLYVYPYLLWPHNNLASRLCERLMEREVEKHCCNSIYRNEKCWKHYIKDVEVVSIGGTKVERPLGDDWRTWYNLLSPPIEEQQGIHFRLKWRTDGLSLNMRTRLRTMPLHLAQSNC